MIEDEFASHGSSLLSGLCSIVGDGDVCCQGGRELDYNMVMVRVDSIGMC